MFFRGGVAESLDQRLLDVHKLERKNLENKEHECRKTEKPRY